MKVSVHMVTYNHEKFIAQAIEGVLMQETDFPYELVIGEDCSTDGTREIVIDYAQRYPDKIRALLREKNLGMWENGRRIREACRGEYIAVCEGDDYWTDPHKLQKQVGFLESHHECASCFHNVTVLYVDGSREPHDFCPPDQKEISTLQDLLVKNFIPTCSTVFRSALVVEVPDWVYGLPMGDWPSHILRAEHGNIGYIGENMAVYRVHAGGVWTETREAQRLRADIDMWELVNAHFGARYDDLIRELVANHWGGIAASCAATAPLDGIETASSEVLDEFAHWSNQSRWSDAWRGRSRAKIYAGLLFAAYEACAFDVVRRFWWQTLRSDRVWWRNRGVWSIGIEAFLGQRIAHLLRRFARSI